MSVSWRIKKEKQGKENRIKHLVDFEINRIFIFATLGRLIWEMKMCENEKVSRF